MTGNDNAISREAVLKEFEKGTENLYGRIDKLPSVMQKSVVLDEIRAEIKKEYEDNVGWCGDNDLYTLGLKKALEIIDRHIAR